METWEKTKENFRPVKEGRSARTLQASDVEPSANTERANAWHRRYARPLTIVALVTLVPRKDAQQPCRDSASSPEDIETKKELWPRTALRMPHPQLLSVHSREIASCADS